MSTVQELKKELFNNGYEESDIKGMKKADLEQALEEANNSNEDITDNFIDFDNVEASDSPDAEEEEDHIGPGHADWTTFLLADCKDDEIVMTEDGTTAIKVHGLRRLTEKHYGQIVNQTVQIVQAPNPDNQWTATAIVNLTIVPHLSKYEAITVGDAADCTMINSTAEFSKFPTSMATTRAEARALRKALKINVVSEEEVIDNDSFSFDNNGTILENQENVIKVMCNKLSVDLDKLVGLSKRNVGNLSEFTQREAANMIQFLNTVQQGTANEDTVASIKEY